MEKENNKLSKEIMSEYPMASSPVYINVPPRVMTWLRESSGYSMEEVSELLKTPVDNVTKWESGDRRPTIDDLRELSKAFNRSLSAFFLPEPLKERSPPEDFRRFPDADKKLTKKTLLGIRKAQYFQEVSKELLDNLSKNAQPSIEIIDISYNEENVAEEQRQNLNFSFIYQKELSNETELLRELIKAIEAKGIFVFQFPLVKRELRGFTLMDILPFSIVINSREHPRAKIFTLMHEFGHILLNIPAMCFPDVDDIVQGTDKVSNVERWCNNFAGSFLMPKNEIIQDIKLSGINSIRQIANKYKVSQSAFLIRAKNLGIIDNVFYNKVMYELRQKNKPDEDFGRSGTSVERAIRNKGKLFCSLVMQNISNQRITDSTALDYLEIKVTDITALQKLL